MIQHLRCTPVLFLPFLMPVIPQKPPPQLLSPEIPADPPGQIPSAGVPPPLALPSIRAAPQAPSSDPGNPLLRSRDAPGFPAFSADGTFQPARYSSLYNRHNNTLPTNSGKAVPSPCF